MDIQSKRVYDAAEPDDGCRILVDRLWPRGVSRADAKIDRWLREIAPSDDLRRWFDHDVAKWEAFQHRYRAELDNRDDVVSELRQIARQQRVTLLFAAKDEQHNNATALLAYLQGSLQ